MDLISKSTILHYLINGVLCRTLKLALRTPAGASYG